MRILLLNPPLKEKTIARDMAGGLGFEVGERTVLPPLGLALLASSLRATEHEVLILDPQVEHQQERELLERVMSFRPQTIIGNVSLPSIGGDALFLRKLKDTTGAKIIPRTEINFLPLLEEILEASGADLVLFGECEEHTEKIVEGKPAPGVAFLADGEIQVWPSVPVENLDTLPHAARELLHNERYLFPLLGAKTTTMQTSRGCPFPCSYYCPYPLVQGKKWRAMSADRVYAELEDILLKHHISNIFFRDACFTLDKKRVAQICELILQNDLRINWWCETRINCLDEELLLLMRSAGCQGINIGVETGDPVVFSQQAKEGLSIGDLQDLSRLSKRIGVRLHFLLLVGLPQEDRSSLYQTFKLVRDLKPPSLGISIVTPYPGTPLYEDALQRGWIETYEWRKYSGGEPVMHTDKLSIRDLRLAQKMLLGCSYFSRHRGPFSYLGVETLDCLFRTWSGKGA